MYATAAAACFASSSRVDQLPYSFHPGHACKCFEIKSHPSRQSCVGMEKNCQSHTSVPAQQKSAKAMYNTTKIRRGTFAGWQYLELDLLWGAGRCAAVPNLFWQPGHSARILQHLEQAAEAAQLHHNCQGYTLYPSNKLIREKQNLVCRLTVDMHVLSAAKLAEAKSPEQLA